MSINTAISRFRSRQAAQFTQTAKIMRPLGEPTYDPVNQETVQAVEVVYTSRVCKVSANERQGIDRDTGETKMRFTDHTAKFAVGTNIEPDDLVEIVSSTYNPADVGLRFRVTDIDRREWQISRRCVVEEVTVPRLWEVQ